MHFDGMVAYVRASVRHAMLSNAPNPHDDSVSRGLVLPMESIDVFCHVLPPEYCDAANRAAKRPLHMFARAQEIEVMVNLDARRRVMDRFPGYRQIPSLASPPPEMITTPDESPDLARRANDALAEMVRGDPERFPSFVATLPLNNPDASLREIDRAVGELGAAGVQVYTSVEGKPLDQPELLSLIEHAAKLDRAVWLHPIRAMSVPDYPGEECSRYDLWWALGWPYETSVAMGRLVFSGLFDRHPDLVLITHHAGGMIPMMEGRLDSGLDLLGTRATPATAHVNDTQLKEKPIDAFRRFHADTASFGSRCTIECGQSFFGTDRLLFATDMPFDPEEGPGYIRDTLQILNEMELTEAERASILSENARRALKLTPSGEGSSTN